MREVTMAAVDLIQFCLPASVERNVSGSRPSPGDLCASLPGVQAGRPAASWARGGGVLVPVLGAVSEDIFSRL